MLPSISINNTSAAYPESINENNNDEVNGLVQEFKNLFNGKEGISTCIKHLLELIDLKGQAAISCWPNSARASIGSYRQRY